MLDSLLQKVEVFRTYSDARIGYLGLLMVPDVSQRGQWEQSCDVLPDVLCD